MTQTILSILALVALSSASVVVRNNTNKTIRDTDSVQMYAKLEKANDYRYFYDEVSNLGDYGYNDNVFHYCITGVWIFYKDADYRYGSHGTDASGMMWARGVDVCDYLNEDLLGKMSSLRYAGASSEYGDDIECFSLYSDTNFYANEYASCKDVYDLGDLAGEGSSVIITNGYFTFYTDHNYGGEHECYGQGFHNTMGGDFNDKFKSVRKGCYSDTVRAEPSPRNVIHKDENGEFGNFVV